MVSVGCCGFARGRSEYFAHFGLVEVQQTFYKPPQPDTPGVKADFRKPFLGVIVVGI